VRTEVANALSDVGRSYSLPRRPEFTDVDRTSLCDSTGQPLFHVEHSAAARSSRWNQWRIAHFTQAVDDSLYGP